MTKTPKKRNPPDATLRNITALKKRVAALELEVRRLHQDRESTYPYPQIPAPIQFVEVFKKGKK
jgi:hypothetical protein